MIDYLAEYFEENNVKFSKQYLERHEIKEISEKRVSFDTLQFNMNNENNFILLYPYLHKINQKLLETNLNVKQIRKLKKDNLIGKSLNVIFAEEILELDHLFIGYQDQQEFIKIDINNFLNNIDFKTNKISENRKYRTTIREVFPEGEKDNLKNHTKCMLGFSIGNDEFRGEKLSAMFKYIDKKYEKCNVLIDDYLYRNTLQILNEELTETEALNKGVELGVESENAILDFAKKSSTEFILSKSSKLIQNKKYHYYLEIFENLNKTNIKFHESALRFSEKFLARNFKKNQRNVNLSIKYLVEELAFFALLLEEGYHIMLYPGDLECLIDIASNKIEGVPEIYDNFIKVVLKNCAK